ncbi:head-tail connector protein [Rahnella aceris]|uniref:head-tail connector protein n=1 Tax=Rahnella sp. (strain Y9602) TaxID=2703885 RepID=UPI001C263630|nr:head-tail connector protein [Rahnella aceris]MBU9866812.1 phage gp6-like head-tail connector protein [Rahnella aceris]
MQFLTLEQVRAQARLEPDYTAEDSSLTLYASAAENAAIKYLNRNLYKESVPPEDLSGMLITADICLAMLMTTSHWYENRSPVTEFEQSSVPLTYQFLLSPYRIIPI